MTATVADRSRGRSDLSRGTLRGLPRRLLRRALIGLLRPLVGFTIEGLEHVPATGPVLVVANHLHNADPVLIEIAFPRPLHFMAKKELFGIPLLGWFVRRVGAFPVDRGKADRAAIRHAVAALAQGIAVGIFPEGTRSTTRSLRRAFPGAGLLALQAGVPVLPTVITGSERLPWNGAKARRRDGLPEPEPGHNGVRVRFAPPLVIPPEVDGRKLTAEAATDLMMREIARLLPSDYRGDYADLVAAETAPTADREPPAEQSAGPRRPGCAAPRTIATDAGRAGRGHRR